MTSDQHHHLSVNPFLAPRSENDAFAQVDTLSAQDSALEERIAAALDSPFLTFFHDASELVSAEIIEPKMYRTLVDAERAAAKTLTYVSALNNLRLFLSEETSLRSFFTDRFQKVEELQEIFEGYQKNQETETADMYFVLASVGAVIGVVAGTFTGALVGAGIGLTLSAGIHGLCSLSKTNPDLPMIRNEVCMTLPQIICATEKYSSLFTSNIAALRETFNILYAYQKSGTLIDPGKRQFDRVTSPLDFVFSQLDAYGEHVLELESLATHIPDYAARKIASLQTFLS